jgi:glutamate synthase (NADPH/NADH) large chain
VTNPPIDPIREEIVMSLISLVSPHPNLLGVDETEPTPRLEVHQPILSPADMAKLKKIDDLTGHLPAHRRRHHDARGRRFGGHGPRPLPGLQARRTARWRRAIALSYFPTAPSTTSTRRSRRCWPARRCISIWCVIGLRTSCGMVVETGAARETHHFATLAGYGAEAIHPWLAFESIAAIAADLPNKPTAYEAQKNYIKAINKGLMKVMSKMGISTYQSYCGAQIFEAVGLSSDFVNRYFAGTPTKVEGIGLKEVAEEALRTHADAWSGNPVLADMLDCGGEYAFRVRGEEHMWTPDAIAKLQHATRSGKTKPTRNTPS